MLQVQTLDLFQFLSSYQKKPIPINRPMNAHAHAHAIPNNLIFTHSTNLLTDIIATTSETNDTQELSDEDKVLQLLKTNVLSSIKLHAPIDTMFLTDQDCHGMLQDYFGNETSEFLMEHYNRAHGMIKGDLCRGLALYKYGGLYMDLDLECLNVTWPSIHVDTTFVTVWEGGSNDFFQAFIGATPRHPIIKRYLHLFVEYYRGNITFEKDFVGVVLLRMAYEQVIVEQPELITTIQLWNETEYDPIEFPSILGTPRQVHAVKGGPVCQYIVFDEHKNVLFWSRIPGKSPWCVAIGSTFQVPT
jgi:Glycosyltransferase sugar-binding region containing DXD motif